MFISRLHFLSADYVGGCRRNFRLIIFVFEDFKDAAASLADRSLSSKTQTAPRLRPSLSIQIINPAKINDWQKDTCEHEVIGFCAHKPVYLL